MKIIPQLGSITEKVNNTPQVRVELGVGEDAVRETVLLMDRVIREGARDLYVRMWAERIITDIPHDDFLRVKEIFDFLGEHTRYTWDMQGTELIKTPQYTLKEIESGQTPLLDCDCMTVLVLALLRAVGYQTAIRAISLHEDGVYRHVYGMVNVNNQWFALDLTRPENGVGWEYPRATRILTRKVV